MAQRTLPKLADTTYGTSGIVVSNPKNLEELSLETFHILIPAVVIISILMVLGLFGNTLAICYYGFKVKKGPAQIFIFSLTIFDLLICCISMPMEIIDIRYYHLFPSTGVCKTLRFVNYFASIASGATLIAIAVDRYRKICKPFNKQITINQARITVCAVSFLSILLSWPSFVIYTVAEVNMTSTLSSNAYDCTTDNDPRMSNYIFVYHIIHFLFFVAAVSILTALYILVGVNLRQYRNFRAASVGNHSKTSPTKETSSLDSSHKHKNDKSKYHVTKQSEQPTLHGISHRTSDNNSGFSSSSEPEEISHMCSGTRRMTNRNSQVIQTNNGKYRSQTISSLRYTCITISITIAFVVSFLPYLCISVWRTLAQIYERNILSEGELLAVEIFFRSFLINSAVNPLIYGFFNTDFRMFVVNVFQLCCRRLDKDGNYERNASSQLSSC